jgi:hypothetical protein
MDVWRTFHGKDGLPNKRKSEKKRKKKKSKPEKKKTEIEKESVVCVVKGKHT